MKTRQLTTMAILTALALVIHTLEAFIPIPGNIPGVKLGLSNIIIIYALWSLGPKDAVQILLIRILLSAVFSGNFMALLYSLGGGTLAILTAIGLKYVLSEDQIWISGCLSAVAHSVGQTIVAIAISGTWSFLIFLPVLLIASILTGIFTGFCGQILVKRGKNLWKTIFK